MASLPSLFTVYPFRLLLSTHDYDSSTFFSTPSSSCDLPQDGRKSQHKRRLPWTTHRDWYVLKCTRIFFLSTGNISCLVSRFLDHGQCYRFLDDKVYELSRCSGQARRHGVRPEILQRSLCLHLLRQAGWSPRNFGKGGGSSMEPCLALLYGTRL